MTGDVVHRALSMSVGVLENVPVPGLSAVAKILLVIWDAVQVVEVSFFSKSIHFKLLFITR